MDLFGSALRQLICISDKELQDLYARCTKQAFKRRELLALPGRPANKIFFVEKGIIRVFITDRDGVEHTTHFAMEGQFICDYSAFLLGHTAAYSLQAIEPLQTIVLPESTVAWGYSNLEQGQKLGRLIAEYYFCYLDKRIQAQYIYTPAERYQHITRIFPNIHNRAPQHMIASYLGITPIHLSRLKKQL
jgi:CRP-like cAMP-binding protein